MSFRINFIFFACLYYLATALSGAGGAQELPVDNDSLIVRQIVFAGNNKTKDDVLAREMKTKVGDRFDEGKVEQDRKRIQNLLPCQVEMPTLLEMERGDV